MGRGRVTAASRVKALRSACFRERRDGFDGDAAPSADDLPARGSIDLAYLQHDRWHVVDFKTNRLAEPTVDEAAEPHLTQLGRYGLTLERAVGMRAHLGLIFLRGGETCEPTWSRGEAALERARADRHRPTTRSRNHVTSA